VTTHQNDADIMVACPQPPRGEVFLRPAGHAFNLSLLLPMLALFLVLLLMELLPDLEVADIADYVYCSRVCC